MLLRERIKKTLEQGIIDQRRLARIAGLSESSISRYLHGYEEVNFESVLRMVKFLFQDEEVEIMAEYVLTQKSRNARMGMEYCVLNKLHDELNVLIENLANAVNPLDKEWAAMYQLIREHREGNISSYDLLSKVEVFKPKEIEMQVLKSIMKGYLYFDLKEYRALELHVKVAENQINAIKSGFIQDSFKVRLGLLMSMVHLLANNVEKARAYSNAILGQDWFEHVKGSAYSQLAQSYMFDDYLMASMYLDNALKKFTEHGDVRSIKVTEYDISFLHSYWKIYQDHPSELEDYDTLTNYIFYLIQIGDKSYADSLLNEINIDELPDHRQAYYWYYKGLLADETKYFYQSIDCFVKIHDYFHLRLPVEQLRRLGENEEALKIFFRKGFSYEEDEKATRNL